MTSSSPPQPEGQTSDSESPSGINMFWLGRQVKTHLKWWHLVIVIALIAMLESQSEPPNYIGTVSVLSVVAVVWLYIRLPPAEPSFVNWIGFAIVFTIAQKMFSEANRPVYQEWPNTPQQFGLDHHDPMRQVNSANYWNTTVVALFAFRYQMASGSEPANEYMRRRIQEYQAAYQKAVDVPTIGVDADLVTMVRRHLMTDQGHLHLIHRLNEYMARKGAPADVAPIEQRTVEWLNLVARIKADPSVVDKLPEGPERAILRDTLAIMTEVSDQFREIEIMQAVLQERYPGTLFPLPKPSPR